MATFKKDDEVYSSHGDLAIYVMPFNGRHIVAPITFDHNGKETIEDVETWHNVYSLPPVKRLTEDHATLELKIKAAKQELNDVIIEKTAFQKEIQKEIDEKTKYLNSIPDLALIMAFHEGRVTHVVEYVGYGGKLYKIIELKDFLADGKDIRLLSLFGNSKGDYQYRINRYSDGSGGNTDCYPFCGEEKAHEFIKNEVIKETNRIVSMGKLDRSIEYNQALEKHCIEYGIQLPTEIQALIKKGEYEYAVKRLADKTEDFNKARDAMIALDKKYGEDDDVSV